MSTHHDSKFVQTVSGALERPRYSPGLILEDSDLTAAVDYTRDLNRMMFRSLFGCGVVCGLTGTADEKCGLTVVVNPGLAIAPCGDPINVSREVKFVIDKPDPNRTDYWILLRNKQRTCENRAVMCDDDDDDAPNQPTRIKDCAEVSLAAELPDCACAHWELRKRLKEDANAATTLLANPQLGTEQLNCDCPSCDAECGCGCDEYIVIGWVHKFEAGWAVLHRGVRRFIRPALQPDSCPNIAPPGSKVELVFDGSDHSVEHREK